MSESTRYDDRIDVDTDLTLTETFHIIGRCLGFLHSVRTLFMLKFGFSMVSVLPPLAVPWVIKIIVDQVILQQPLNTGEIPFPPFMMPFIQAIEDLSPSSIMLSVMGLFLVTMVVFGMRANPATQAEVEGMPQGYDAATQSEQALSAGGSNANGLWGLMELALTIRMTQRLANSLRVSLMGRFTRLEMTTLDDQRIGDSIYRVMYDAPMLPEMIYRLTIKPVLLVFTAALSIYFIHFSYGSVMPELVWLAAALVPLTLCLTVPFSGLARRLHQTNRAAGSSTTNRMEEGIDNVAAVQSLGGMHREAQRFGASSSESYRRHRLTVLLDLFLSIVARACMMSTMAVGFVFITDDVISGTLSLGDYAVLWGMFTLLGYNASEIGLYWVELQKNVAAVRRVFFFIDYTSEVDRPAEPMAPLREAIVFNNVGFAYPDGRIGLSEVNLQIPVGKLVAIVGPTGAGKTTLAYLLPGYLRPSSGDIHFDEQNINEVDFEDIRNQVTYVFQEHMLLSDTIRENLLLANPNASEGEMLEACRIAGAMEFIDNLTDGIDTPVGKGGDTLSVGQKQRLSIARGLVRHTPILVLDEPTAALDPQTENALMASLKKVVRARLVIVIAHRLSTIREADQIVFLEAGRVVEVGDHDTLMNDPNGRYRQFVDLQSN